jgi:AcrR family transcriptional regulator
MARPKSDDKRNAILAAAIAVFAERGLGAPTSAISKAAGVAEGTLFTYFSTKDELVNALYRELKLELADGMLSNFPRKKNLRSRLEHIWNGYVQWGVANPAQCKVLGQLQVSDALTEETKAAGSAPFAEIQEMSCAAVEQRLLKNGLPLEFVTKTLGALAQATMELMVANPAMADAYREYGFEMFWAGIARK